MTEAAINEQIRNLGRAFAREGNYTMARFCDRASIGNLLPDARARCMEIIQARLK